jgi:flagellar basal-body rod protein FlgB
MPIKSLFGKTYHLIERSLDIAKLRHGVIASNVANLDTPGYRPKEINFDKALKDAQERNPVDLTRTHPLHFGLQGGRYEISYEERDERVDIDQEMSKLAENNLRYQTDIEVLLRKFSMLKQGITEGGR